MNALSSQLDYYRARAAEYDEWWLRRGRYDRGAALNAQWFAEAAEVQAALEASPPRGRVLEIACGTGLWSERLLPCADELTLLDGAPEMLALAGARLQSPRVKFREADIFTWQPAERYDGVFFSFWLSHVPPDLFAAFWEKVRDCLAPGGRFFLVDSRRDPTSTAQDHQLPEAESVTHRRRLNDGREFDIYKIFHDPAILTEQLSALGWQCDLRTTEHYFLHGSGTRARL